MKLKLITAAILATLSMSAQATNTPYGDCVGDNACKTDNRSVNTHAAGGNQSQGQHQNQGQSAYTGNMYMTDAGQVSVDNRETNHVAGDRYISVRPVHVEAAPIVTPSAGVSRMVDQSCGPRQIVRQRNISGINNRSFGVDKLPDVAVDQWLEPDREEPYRIIQVLPDLKYVVGHKIIETSAVVTVSTNGGFAIGGNGNNGGGGSFGVQSGGALQRLVTTIRLEECTAFVINQQRQPAPVKKKCTTCGQKQRQKQQQTQQIIVNVNGQAVNTTDKQSTASSEQRAN